jgi:hypothetical protein
MSLSYCELFYNKECCLTLFRSFGTLKNEWLIFATPDQEETNGCSLFTLL